MTSPPCALVSSSVKQGGQWYLPHRVVWHNAGHRAGAHSSGAVRVIVHAGYPQVATGLGGGSRYHRPQLTLASLVPVGGRKMPQTPTPSQLPARLEVPRFTMEAQGSTEPGSQDF